MSARIIYAATSTQLSVAPKFILYDDALLFLHNVSKLFEAWDTTHQANYIIDATGSLAVSGVNVWHLNLTSTIINNTLWTAPKKINATIIDPSAGNDVIGSGVVNVNADLSEINPDTPLGVSIEEFLDTILATVSGASSGAGSGLETFYGITGLQRVQSTISNGNRTDVQYGP